MKLAKIGSMAMMVMLALALAFTGMPVQAQDGTATTYNRIDEVLDWGAATTKLIVNLQAEVPAGSVDTESFSVFVVRNDPRQPEPFLEEGYRNVVDAYISDAEGNPVDAGSYATLVMEVGPTISLGNALNYGNDPVAGRRFNAWTANEYTITQEKAVGDVEGLVATELDQYWRLLIDEFEFSAASYEDEKYGPIELTYAHYTPEDDGGSHPLLVWFHGGGEGGTDPTIPLAANRAAAFASEEIQSYFDGAYVLVPQAPTRWMDTGYDDDTHRGIESIFTRAAQDLVESYVAEHPAIDTNRIYVGGLSNGGYMTVRLLLDYPDYYAAGVLVAEPFTTASASDAMLLEIADIPMWFVSSASDPTVVPHEDPLILYERLIQLGASDVHFSYLPRVVDETGLYMNEDGTPHEYNGHWSWIYVYNNDLAEVIVDNHVVGKLYGQLAHQGDAFDGEVVTIMEWLAAQSK